MAWATAFARAEIEVVLSAAEARGGDYLFLISCAEIVKKDVRTRYRHTLVIHASDLPHGRGWSPVAWTVLSGDTIVTVSMLEAEDKVDTGAIWAQRCFELQGHELLQEINQHLFDMELELMEYAIDYGEAITPRPQATVGSVYYERRKPSDSRIDPHKSIAEQFDLLRVSDDVRFPAFFEYRGYRYELRLIKAGPADPQTDRTRA